MSFAAAADSVMPSSCTQAVLLMTAVQAAYVALQTGDTV